MRRTTSYQADIRRITISAGMIALVLLAGPAGTMPVAAQDVNFARPIPEIERRIQDETFRIISWHGARAVQDRTHRIAMSFADSMILLGKWATAPENASAFNNEPRYELGAYAVQKLFLGPDEYVVPPTVIRAFDIEFAQEWVPDVRPTFRKAPGSVLVTLSYWLNQITPDGFWDSRRAADDSIYARHIGNMNILTYLIRHRDANVGNFLISVDSANPRVFSVDNGVTFESQPSDRGTEWSRLRIERMPAGTIERLQRITREDLDRALGVLVEFELRDGRLVPVEPGENLNPGRGIRQSDDRIQIGLSSREISGVENRIRNLLNQVNSGRYPLF
ncbi:hypothetical protein BH23GEM10_BH23GEM10_07470 [soil metagenome]